MDLVPSEERPVEQSAELGMVAVARVLVAVDSEQEHLVVAE